MKKTIRFAIEKKKNEKEIIESRDLLHLKLGNILSPDSDADIFDLLNIFESFDINAVTRDFYKVTHISNAIIDLKGNIICSNGWQEICTNFHRANKESCRNCIDSDIYLTKNVKQGQFLIYKCKNNLWDVATPIFIGKKHIGNLFLGQFLFIGDGNVNEIFEKQAERFGFNKIKYIKALNKVPRLDRQQLENTMKFFSNLASMISSLIFSNINLARTINDFRFSEAKLKKSEEKYRLFFENSADGLYITTIDGNYIDVNNSLVKMLGYRSKKELMAINVAKQLYLSEDERPVPEKRNGIFEAKLKKKDGSLMYAQINSRVEFENGKPKYYKGMLRDVTEKVQLQGKLEEVAKQWNSTFDAMKDSISITDSKGKILRANKSMMQLLGKKYTDIIGKKCENILGSKIHPGQKCKLEKVCVSRRRSRKVERFGDKYIACIIEPIIDNNDNFTGTVHIISDITKQKIAEKSKRDNLARVKKTFRQTVDTLSRLVEVRDLYTAGHQKKVADIATAIAKDMGLSKDKVDAIKLSALIHDIGKISVPASILSKPGMITDIERTMIETHSRTGYEIVKDIDFPFPVADIILQHHERLDGSGYPKGLKSGQIMIEAKILAVADLFEAMTAHRPYRSAYSKKSALGELTKNRATLYDAKAVDSCIKLFG